MSDVKLPQQARLASIDWHMLTHGYVVRQEHTRRFGLESATSTRDLALYTKLCARGTVGYDRSEKCHIALPGFKPLFVHSSETMAWSQYYKLEELQAMHRLLNSRFGTPSYSTEES